MYLGRTIFSRRRSTQEDCPKRRLLALAATWRPAIAIVGLFALEGCAPNDTIVTTLAPAGKSPAQHNFDANRCDRQTGYSSNRLAAYDRCMHALGYAVVLDDGRIWPGAAPYVAPSAPEESQEENTSNTAQQSEPSAPPSGGRPLTGWEKLKIAVDLGIQYKSASSKCEDSDHKLGCELAFLGYGMREDEKLIICTHPDILDLAHISPETKESFISFLHCQA